MPYAVKTALLLGYYGDMDPAVRQVVLVGFRHPLPVCDATGRIIDHTYDHGTLTVIDSLN